jgi:hypothetical protein
LQTEDSQLIVRIHDPRGCFLGLHRTNGKPASAEGKHGILSAVNPPERNHPSRFVNQFECSGAKRLLFVLSAGKNIA